MQTLEMSCSHQSRRRSCRKLDLTKITLGSETALAHIDFSDSGLNTSELCGLVVGELVHRLLAQVQSSGGMVDAENVDGLAL